MRTRARPGRLALTVGIVLAFVLPLLSTTASQAASDKLLSVSLHLTVPSSNPPFSALAYRVKLTFSGEIPVLGAPDGSQLIDLGIGYHRIMNSTNGMATDRWGDSANGAPARQEAWNGGDTQQWQLALDGSGSTTVGSTTVMWTPNSSTNNEWTITGA